MLVQRHAISVVTLCRVVHQPEGVRLRQRPGGPYVVVGRDHWGVLANFLTIFSGGNFSRRTYWVHADGVAEMDMNLKPARFLESTRRGMSCEGPSRCHSCFTRPSRCETPILCPTASIHIFSRELNLECFGFFCDFWDRFYEFKF